MTLARVCSAVMQLTHRTQTALVIGLNYLRHQLEKHQHLYHRAG